MLTNASFKYSMSIGVKSTKPCKFMTGPEKFVKKAKLMVVWVQIYSIGRLTNQFVRAVCLKTAYYQVLTTIAIETGRYVKRRTHYKYEVDAEEQTNLKALQFKTHVFQLRIGRKCLVHTSE